MWPEALDRATELFDEALALAPDEPAILAACAMAHARRSFFFGGNETKTAADTAARAVSMAPNHAEARLALATVRLQSGSQVQAVQELEYALAQSPTLAGAHLVLGQILLEVGPVAEAVRHLEMAITFDPELTLGFRDLARAQILLGRPDESKSYLDKIADESSAQIIRVAEASRLAVWRRDVPEAARILTSIEEAKMPTVEPISVAKWIARVALRGERFFRAFSLSEFAQEGGLRRRAFYSQIEAELAAYVDDRDRCLEAIEIAVASGLVDIAWMDGCPLFGPMHGMARFDALRNTVEQRAERIRSAWQHGL